MNNIEIYQELPRPRIILELTGFSIRKGWGVVIGSDANSNNEIWGSTDTNDRGENLLKYIMDVCMQ